MNFNLYIWRCSFTGIEVLVATMHQKDYSLLEKLNIQSDAVVVNQCDRNCTFFLEYKGHRITWIDSTDRGLSKSRNMALKCATQEICILCDEDERLNDGYCEILEKAFEFLPRADIVVFNIVRIGREKQEKRFKAPKKVKWFKTYGSVHISFRRESIIRNDIDFNIDFGTGSGMYLCAEDAIFCMDCHRKKLRMYTYPWTVCEVECGTSTWFSGFNEHYFYDVGAYLSVAFPKIKHLMKWYYPFHFMKLSKLPLYKIIRYIRYGFEGYKKHMNYDNYMRGKHNS